MTTYNTGPTATTTQNGQVHRNTAPALVAPRGRRRPWVIVGGIVLAGIGALIVVTLVASAGDRTSVLRVARDVPYGATITAADVTRTEVAVDAAVGTVAADDLAGVVGRSAASNLVAGSLLAPGQLSPAGPLTTGDVLVPLALASGRIPAGGLETGDRLLIVDTPPADADPPATAPRTFEVTVARVGAPDLNGVSVVDVVAPEADGPAVAARAATGRFALVVQAPNATATGADS
jgi:hypothetical protein